MKDRLLAFIVPYFGKLPNELPCVLKTIETNENYDWIIFTDDETEYEYPPNVIVYRMSFCELRALIERKFDFPIGLNSAKKLCDFKPAYGYIFEEYLQRYQFWGYCDLDQYFGDLSKFISFEYLNQYDKVFSLGHMTIYRNNQTMNRLFMNRDQRENLQYSSYVDIFKGEKIYVFDEWPEENACINRIAEQNHVRCAYDWPMADILPYRSHYELSIYYTDRHEWSGEHATPNGMVLWENGKCYFVTNENELRKDEVLYAHLQKRPLNMKAFHAEIEVFMIIPAIPDRIISCTRAPSDAELAGILFCLKIMDWLRIRIHGIKVSVQREIGSWKHKAKNRSDTQG